MPHLSTLRVRMRSLLACVFCLALCGPQLAAAGMTSLPTISTDGKTYLATFAAGLSRDNGSSFATTATTHDSVLIQGRINPDPAHIGAKGDLYVVVRTGNQFVMRVASGAFLPWNGYVATLLPFQENITLGSSHTVEVYRGQIATSGDHRVYVGYLPKLGNTGLIYSGTALRLGITGATGTNGRALPFEAGYFPGLDQARVVMTNSELEISADDRTLVTQYPLDRLIVRTLLVKNIRSVPVKVTARATMSFAGYDEANFSRHPQTPYLFLAPGESQPYRITYEIPEQSSNSPNAWTLGQQIPVQMKLYLSVQPGVGSNPLPEFSIDVPARIDVVRAPNAPGDTSNPTNPTPNAVIQGIARDEDTGLPLANTQLEIVSSFKLDPGGYRVTTDANGAFTANVHALLRTGGASSWLEYFIRRLSQRNQPYSLTPVIPRAGETLTVELSLPAERSAWRYQQTGSIDLGLNAYAADYSASGNTIATVPFHTEVLPTATVEARANLTVFTLDGTLLWKLPIRGPTPAVDVSDDGSLIATTTQNLVPGSPFQTGGKAIVYNRAGTLLREIPLQTTNDSGWGTEQDAPFMEVRISRDNRYLAAGDQAGRVLLVDIASGDVRWRKFVDGTVRRIDFDLHDERVFVSGGDGWLRTYNLAGELLWESWIDSWATSMDVSEHYLVAIGKSHRSGLHLIDKVTGAQLWAYQTDYTVNQARIAPDESGIYTTSAGPSTHTVFSMSGQPLTRVGGTANAAAYSGDGKLIVHADACTVSVLDRKFHSLFKSENIGDAASCINGRSYFVATSADGANIAAAAGEYPAMTGRVHFIRRIE